ncbi:hypothetical protein ACIQPT_34680 [Streptomyces sp. NPDC091289]|uniref:hypothetical protein n=1 Tax=Streptomyces sp. NPDC091289 TaxID=3365989 RepID=UPI00382F9706
MSTETVTRREWLAAYLAAHPGTYTTQTAAMALSDSPFAAHRNTARKDMRALTAAGIVTAHDTGGRRTYRTGATT